MKAPHIIKIYLQIFGLRDLPPKDTNVEIGKYHTISPNSWPKKNNRIPNGFLKLI